MGWIEEVAEIEMIEGEEDLLGPGHVLGRGVVVVEGGTMTGEAEGINLLPTEN